MLSPQMDNEGGEWADDGYISPNEGWAYNQALFFNEWRAYYGNLTYPLLSSGLVEELSVLPATYQANYYNDTEWAASRGGVVSCTDSLLNQVVKLVAEGNAEESNLRYPGGWGWTPAFGKQCKVFLKLRQLTNEFDYTSHDGDLRQADVENYKANTDSGGEYNYKNPPAKNYEYYLTRSSFVKTVNTKRRGIPTLPSHALKAHHA